MEPRSPLNLQLTITGIGVLVVLGGAIWFGMGPDEAVPLNPTEVVVERPVEVLTVHVSGAVVRPGLASVGTDARVADVVAAVGGATSDADLSRINLASLVRDGDHISVPTVDGEENVGRATEDDGLDLNRASAVQLEDLDGVGPVLALRIVEFRDANGPFETVEDLLDVPGIGEAKLAGMRSGISYP